MTSFNGTLEAPGYGTQQIRVLSIGHGVSIVSTEAQAKNKHAIYMTKRTSGSFGLTLQVKRDEVTDLADWLIGYGRLLSDPADPVGPMKVSVPSRNFSKVAIPAASEYGGAIPYGDRVGVLTFRMELSFIGARDPLEYTSELLSSFQKTINDPINTTFFYPAATQLSGVQTAEEVLYGPWWNKPPPVT